LLSPAGIAHDASMRIRSAALLCALICFAAAPAQAQIVFDFTQLPSSRSDLWQLWSCGVLAVASERIEPNLGVGIGVRGGSADSRLDGNEWIYFEVDAASANLSYDVLAPGNENGTGGAGDARVEAFDASWNPLGSVAVSGGGTRSVSALFPGAAIAAFRIVATGDSQRIGALRWRPPAPAPLELRFDMLGGFEVQSLTLCGVTVSGSGGLSFAEGLGVGVTGFFDNTLVDGNESFRIDFDALVNDVEVASNQISDHGDQAVAGQGLFQAFGDGLAFLGTTSVSGFGPFDLAAAISPQPFSRVAYFASANDGRGFSRLRFVPEPARGLVAAAALAALWLLRRRRLRHLLAFAVLLLPVLPARADVVLDFTQLSGTNAPPDIQSCGVVVNGSNLIRRNGLDGIGVLGGNDARLDGAESLRFSFSNALFQTRVASAVSYDVVLAGNENASGAAGDATVEGFDANGVSLGTVAVAGSGSGLSMI
jgi:hypothetical protein